MKSTSNPVITLAITLSVVLASAADSRAQNRNNPRGTRFAPIPNPAHEKLKTQADQEYQRGNYAKVVELTDSVIRENANDHVAHYLRGSARAEIARQRGDAKGLRAAIADSRQAISLDGARTPMYYLPYLYGMTSLTALEQKNEHAEVSVKVAGQVIALPNIKPEDRANLYYQRGVAYVALKKYKEAFADFQSAIEDNKLHLGAYLAAGDAYAQAGDADNAKRQYDAAVRTFDDNPLVFNNRGMFLQGQGKLDAAIADYTKALELNNRYYFAATNRAVCLHQQGRLDAAVNDFTNSLKLNPQQPAVHAMRAAVHMSRGDADAAVVDNRAAVRLDSKNPSAHADLGFSLFFAGRYADADAAFERSLQLDKKQHHLSPWRFVSMERSGNKGKAIEQFEGVLKKEQNKRDWVESLVAYLAGWIDEEKLFASTNQKDEDVKAAQACEAHYFVGLRQQSANNGKSAREHFEKAVATDQRQLSAYQGAQLALKKDNVAGAGTDPKRVE